MIKLIARIGTAVAGAALLGAAALASPASASASFTATESSSHVLCSSTFAFAQAETLTFQGSGKTYTVTSADGTCAFVNLVLPGHAGTILHGTAS